MSLLAIMMILWGVDTYPRKNDFVDPPVVAVDQSDDATSP